MTLKDTKGLKRIEYFPHIEKDTKGHKRIFSYKYTLIVNSSVECFHLYILINFVPVKISILDSRTARLGKQKQGSLVHKDKTLAERKLDKALRYKKKERNTTLLHIEIGIKAF
ncbi:hypothetical protein BpHYR1_019682 [Brachionus plicatilis]|uniref:Uncharacterized protein n=1 Tax=Brachionus plicatilis TaxID=10195 RepID=A0A3M7RH41_BRAPC|nr:hypothetical protein BpHYR1_019682 [Brachionus plicatilis]